MVVGEDGRALREQVGDGLGPFALDVHDGGDLDFVADGVESGDMLPRHGAAADENDFVFHVKVVFMGGLGCRV